MPLTADLRVGDWLVQPSLGRISRNGQTVAVRAKVMDLLLFLAARPGLVVSKDDLLDGVWGTRDVSESALTRTVTELRQAFGDDVDAPQLLETIPKRGYRLIPPVTLFDSSSRTQPGALTAAPAVREGKRRSNWWIVAVLGVLTMTGVGALTREWWRETSKVATSSSPPRPAPQLSASLSAHGLRVASGGLAITPDGRTLIFAASGPDGQRLYTRRIDETAISPLAGTEGALAPFVSPDGQWVGFNLTQGGLFKTPIGGGVITRITDFGRNGSWGRDDRITFVTRASSRFGGGLWSIPAIGGAAAKLPASDQLRVRVSCTPEVLPNGSAVLAVIEKDGNSAVGVLIKASGRFELVSDNASHPRYLSSGHLLYLSSGHLYSVAFDQSRLKVSGTPQRLLDNIGDAQGGGAFAVSENGTLAYVAGAAVLRRLAWLDRAGVTTPLHWEPRPYVAPVLSPDGKVLAATVGDYDTAERRNIWIGPTNGLPTRLTTGHNDAFSIFSPDGKRIAYSAEAPNEGFQLKEVATDGTGAAKIRDGGQVTAWSKSGVLLITVRDSATRLDILQMQYGRPETLHAFRNTSAQESYGALSPDERFVAYASDEDKEGSMDIYVAPLTDPGRKSKLSSGGGNFPIWNPTGDEVLYQSETGIMSVAVRDGEPLGPPVRVLPHRKDPLHVIRDWTIGPDGRFLVIEPVDSPSASNIEIMINWPDKLNKGPK